MIKYWPPSPPFGAIVIYSFDHFCPSASYWMVPGTWDDVPALSAQGG